MVESLKTRALSLLKKHWITPKKSLGQNFLVDDAVIKKEVEAAGVAGKDVIEIGAGLGFLTEGLAKAAKKVLAIEKDRRFEPILNEVLEDLPNVELIFADALEVDLPKWKVVSNIPYQISSPMTFKLLEQGQPALICYQKEFAERMLAQPGDRNYGRLSVNCALLSQVKRVMDVPKTAFWPIPQVDSTVVLLEPKKRPKNWEQVKKVVDAIFLYPNKTVKKVSKITGIAFPEEWGEMRVRELSTDQLVATDKYLK